MGHLVEFVRTRAPLVRILLKLAALSASRKGRLADNDPIFRSYSLPALTEGSSAFGLIVQFDRWLEDGKASCGYV